MKRGEARRTWVEVLRTAPPEDRRRLRKAPTSGAVLTRSDEQQYAHAYLRWALPPWTQQWRRFVWKVLMPAFLLWIGARVAYAGARDHIRDVIIGVLILSLWISVWAWTLWR